MKQSISRFLLLTAVLVFGLTTAWAQKSVFSESFTGSKLPDGWSTTNAYWEVDAESALYSASGAIENAADTLVSPLINLSGLDNVPSLKFTYSLAAYSDKVNILTVLYRASKDAEWAEWKVFNEATDGQQAVKDALPEGLTNVQLGFALAYKQGGESRLHFVSLENKTEGTEAPTGLKTEDLTTTSVTLYWDVCKSSMFRQYNVKVSTSKMTDMSADGDVANLVNVAYNNDFLELDKLTPNQEYWLYVQYDYGDGDLSPWAELSFKTPCESISGTFAEDFEGALSTCYTIVKNSTAAEVSNDYAYQSQKSFKSNSVKGKYNFFILPEFSGDVKNFQVSFMAASSDGGNTYARTVTVGVCTEATAESFTEVKTLNLPKGRSWEQVVVTLKGYNGTGKYIAFRFGNEDKENHIFIDDIHIQTAQACPKPMFVEVYDINPENAKLKWVETGDATEWNLVLSTKYLVDPEAIEPDAAKGEFAGSISANPYTAANLQPNTTYYAYLQAGCGSSEWTNAVEFKTSRAVSYPYSEHFDRLNPDDYTNTTEAIPNGWVMDDRGNNPDYASYYDKQNTNDSYRPYVTTTQNHDETPYVTASLFLRGTSITGSTSQGYTSIAMLPAMPKAVNTMMITFWAKAVNGNHTLKVGVANTQTNDLPQGKQLGVNITEVGEATIIKDEWKQYKVLLTGYTGEGRYIALYIKPETGTPNVYIDDIEIDDAPDCNTVSSVTATATGIDKATVEWVDASSSTSWVVKVSSTEIEPSAADGDIVAAQTVNAKSYNITGLEMGGTYYIYVSPSCGDMWKSTTVTTLVGLQVPYFNDFTNETTGAVAARGPKNWKLGFTYNDTWTTSGYVPYVYNTAWTNPPAGVDKPSLYLNNSTSASYQYPYAIMPELLNGDVKDMKMAFYLYTTATTNLGTTADPYYSELKIGVVSSPSDISKANKFTKVTNVATIRTKASKVAQYEVVDLSAYTGTGKYIVFYQAMESPNNNKTNTTYLDNLYIGSKSDPIPAAPIANLKYTSLTTTGATLTWTEQAEATQWNVRVFTKAQEDPAAGEPVFSTTVNSPTATITGLTHSSQYYAYIQSVQSNGNGAWVSTMFWTDCEKAPLPFTEDFNSYDHGSTSLNTLSWCYLVGDKGGSQMSATYTGTTPYNNNYVKNGQATTSATTATGPGTSYYYVDHTYGNDPTTNTFYMYAGKDKLALLVLPELDGDLATMTMRFYGSYSTVFSASGSSGGAIEIAIMNEDGTFTHVENCKLTKAKEWEEFNVTFPSDIHSGRITFRIDNTAAWRSSIGSTYSSGATFYMYLDDIKVQQIPQCLKVLEVDVQDIEATSAKISWEASEASAWNLKVSTVELADPDAVTADIFDGAISTTPSKALNNLPDNSILYIYVQTVRPEKSCVGEWSNVKTFKTLCLPQAFPYVEDFQSYETTGAGNLPDCAVICGQDPNHSYISTKGTGNKAVYINQTAKEHKNYFVFPPLQTDDVRKLQLSMQVWVGSTATSTYRYQVGIMTDPNDPSTFVSLHNEELLGSSNPYDRSYKFDNYQGDETGTKFGGYIAISPRDYTTSSSSTGYTSMYIDNVTIDFIETCIKPTDLKADSIGIYGAKLKWTTDDKTAAHRVRIYDNPEATPDSEDFVVEKVVNADSVVIESGLKALTKYYAFVRKECAADDLSKWSSSLQFKTECPETRAIPYEENFDGDTEPIGDYCWASFMIQGPSGCTTDYNSKMSTSAKKDGTRGLYLQYTDIPSQSGGSCVGTHRSAAITPELEVESLKDLLIYFDVKRSSSTNASLKIEAVSDETKDADAIYITTINDITADWAKAYIKLGDYYTSVQAYKRLRFSTTTASGIYIDNLVITNDLNTVLPVEALKATMLTENSIKISFVEFTPSIKQWQVAYVVAGGDIADATVKTIDATEYTIEGLAANTSYDIYVRGNVDGNAWVGPLTATTLQTPAPLPLITGFEDDADNAMWSLYNVQTVQGDFYPNFWIVGKADSCAGTGENALFITNDSARYEAYGNNTYMDPADYPWMSSVTSTSYIWATRNIKVEDAGTYKFSFKLKSPTPTSGDGLYAQLIPAGATFKAGTATLPSGATRSGSATSASDANGCYLVMGKQNNVADWTWYSTSLDIEEAGIYTLAFYWYNASSPSAESIVKPAAIDSVIVEEYLCTTPKDIEFTNRAANEVSIKWFSGKCKNFEYVLSRYAKLGNPALIDAEDKVAYGTLSDGPAITFTSLMPQTKYSFYVRTICEDGYTNWVEFDFETPCGKIDLPYAEGFFETPECWILSGASVGTTTVGTSASNEIWNRLQLNATSGYAILPELSVDIKNVEVEIGLFNTSTNFGAVSLGVMDNTYDMDTYKEVALFQTQTKPGSTGTYTPTQLEVFNKMLNLYKGTGKVLAIKNATAYNIGIKYITLTELPDCVRPQQVELTYVTENSVTVNWIAGVEEAWEIKLNDQIIENVTTNPYKITGLEQGTVYEVSVRALCSETDASDWSVPATFQTACGVNPLPMFEDFSGLKAENKRATITCWSNMATDQPIEQVFNGNISPYEPDGGTYYTYMWIANYLTQLGDEHQLLFFGSTLLTGGPKYRWMITPQYTIEGKASVSFDVKHVDNKNMAANPTGRFFVAVSTDNGATWKKEDATLIEGIDSVFTTKSVLLDKYNGKNIRVAFYMENLGGTTTNTGSGLFTLLDNVRMNCTEDYEYADNACQGYDYEGYGFSIAKEDIPVLGKDSTYYRLATNSEAGCDSVIALTLTTRPAGETQTLYATICDGEVYEFGGQKFTKPNPEGQPYYILSETEYGCDVNINLYLTVLESDTTDHVVSILNTDLPYVVDEYYTVPEDAAVGSFVEVIKIGGDEAGCQFNRYIVTISQCQQEVSFADQICEDQTLYEGYGFEIAKEEMPAAGTNKQYFRTSPDETGCDSIITFTLTVQKADTTDIVKTILQADLPYVVDEYYTVPADAEGEVVEVIKILNECAFNRYVITIETPQGLADIMNDAVDHIEIYDAVGRQVLVVSKGDDIQQITLPTGVYLVLKVMRNNAPASVGKMVVR